MRHWRAALVILGLVLFFALVTGYLVSRSPQYDPTEDHASFRTNEWGTKALRELCERNGLAAATHRRPWDEFAAPARALLCIFDPNFGPNKREIEALAEWAKNGGHVLVAVDTDGVFAINPVHDHIDANHVLLGYLGLISARRGGAGKVEVTQPTPSSVGFQVTGLMVGSGERLARLDSPEQFTQHLRKLVNDDRELPVVSPVEVDEYVPLLADEAGVLVMRLKVGSGIIDVLSDADILGNERIGQADNALLAMNLIYCRGAPTAVHFDEYHHGRAERPFADERLPGAAIFPAIWAGLICLAIYLSGSFWRFGRPVPLPPEPRRSLTEHIQAFAGLYRGAQASGAAVTTIARRFESRLAALTGLSPAAAADDLARAVARTADIDVAALSQLLTELRAIDPDAKLPEARLLWLVRRIAYFEEALNDGKLPGSNL